MVHKYITRTEFYGNKVRLLFIYCSSNCLSYSSSHMSIRFLSVNFAKTFSHIISNFLLLFNVLILFTSC